MNKFARYLNPANLRSTLQKNKPLLHLHEALPLERPLPLEPVHVPKPVKDVRVHVISATEPSSISILTSDHGPNPFNNCWPTEGQPAPAPTAITTSITKPYTSFDISEFVSIPLSTYTSISCPTTNKRHKITKPSSKDVTWISLIPGLPTFGSEFLTLRRLSSLLLVASKSSLPKAYADELVRWLSKLYGMYPTMLAYLTPRAWNFLFSLERDHDQLPSYRAKVIGDAAVATGVTLAEAQEVVYIGGLFWNDAREQAFKRLHLLLKEKQTEAITSLGVRMLCIERQPNKAMQRLKRLYKVTGHAPLKLYVPIILAYNHLYKGQKGWEAFQQMLQLALDQKEKIPGAHLEDIAISFLDSERPEKAMKVFFAMVWHRHRPPKYVHETALAIQDLIRTRGVLRKFCNDMLTHFKHHLETRIFYGNWIKNLGDIHEPWLALKCLQRMQTRGIMPDASNVNGVIRAFLKAGLSERAEELAEELVNERMKNNEFREKKWKKWEEDQLRLEEIESEREKARMENRKRGTMKRLVRDRERIEQNINISLLHLIELDTEFRNILNEANAKIEPEENYEDHSFQTLNQSWKLQRHDHVEENATHDQMLGPPTTIADSLESAPSVMPYKPTLQQRMQNYPSTGNSAIMAAISNLPETRTQVLLLSQPAPLLQLPSPQPQMPMMKPWNEWPEANIVTISLLLNHFTRTRNPGKVFHYFSLMKACKLPVNEFCMNHLLWGLLRQRDFVKLANTFKTMTERTGVMPDMVTWRILWLGMWKQLVYRRWKNSQYFTLRELFGKMVLWLPHDWGQRDHAMKNWEIAIKCFLVARDWEAAIVAINAGYKLWNLLLNKSIIEHIARAVFYRRLKEIGKGITKTGEQGKKWRLTRKATTQEIEKIEVYMQQVRNSYTVNKKFPQLMNAMQKAREGQVTGDNINSQQIPPELISAFDSVLQGIEKKFPKEVDKAKLETVTQVLMQLADNHNSMIFIERLKDAREEMGVEMVGIMGLLKPGRR